MVSLEDNRAARARPSLFWQRCASASKRRLTRLAVLARTAVFSGRPLHSDSLDPECRSQLAGVRKTDLILCIEDLVDLRYHILGRVTTLRTPAAVFATN